MINAYLNNNIGYSVNATQYLPLIIDYTATQFVFKWKAPATSTLKFHWGDGTTSTVSGNDATLVTTTSSYSGAGTYSFYITGDALDLTYIDISSQAFVSGDVSSWSALTNLTYLYCSSTSISGDVSGWSALTNLTLLRCYSTSVSGDVSGWSALTNLTYLDCSSTSVEFNGTTAWTMTGAISLYSNGWTSTMVDNSLAAFAATPLTGCTIDVSGTNAARTAASDADKAIIINPANSNTLTVNE